MVTLIVEDGSGLTNSNVYCTVDEADTYHEAHLYTESWIDDVDKKIAALVWATRLLDEHVHWKGRAVFPYTQALAWPRATVFARDGLAVPINIVPKAVKDATAEFARLLMEGDRAAGAEDPVILSKNVSNSSTSITFAGGEQRKRVVPDSVLSPIRQYIDTSTRVLRA